MIASGLKSGVYLKDQIYKIEGVLGQGTFGITYLASAKIITEGNLGKMTVNARVAIKEFFMGEVNNRREDSAQVEGSTGKVFCNYRNKFRKEAQNLAKLSHNGIVQVLDVFDENHTTYYVMEYIDGINLDDYIDQKGTIPEKEAITILKAIGDALEYIHSRKMLHLDLKPKNIMLRKDGTPCLIDFGLAKHFTDDGEPESSTSIGLGTPGYAPLEQVHYRQGGNFPATLDIYALGGTLFKMLTGKRVPDASTILNDGFPEDEVREAGVSVNTIEALRHAMHPIAKYRTQTNREFINELEDEYTQFEVTPKFEDEQTNYEESSTNSGEIAFGTSTQLPSEESSTPPSCEEFDNLLSETTLKKQNHKSKKGIKELITSILIVVGSALAVVICVWIFRIPSKSSQGQEDSTKPSYNLEEKVILTVTDMTWQSPLGEAIYTGEVIQDTISGFDRVIPHGKGIAKILSGEYRGNTYEGEFNNGKMEGRTTYTLKNGDTFVGLFKDNKYDRGRYKFKSNGQYFEGTFVNGQAAKGNWYYKNGTKM